MSDIATASTPLMNVLLPVVVGRRSRNCRWIDRLRNFNRRTKDVADKKQKRHEKFEELAGVQCTNMIIGLTDMRHPSCRPTR